jgi:ribonuclease-3
MGALPVLKADPLGRAEQAIGYSFKNPGLLRLALTHSSLADARLDSNERLEFLGDAVLGTIVCESLYRRFDDWLEGELTKVKSTVVSRKTCARISDDIGLTELLMLGKGVAGPQRIPLSLRAAVFESVIGAVFLDGGFDAVRAVVLEHVSAHIDACLESEDQGNYKSTLQQHAQRWLSRPPAYETLDEQGPDHSKCFEMCVVIGQERFPSAWGPSKKTAEQEAAKRALEVLRARRHKHAPEDKLRVG